MLTLETYQQEILKLGFGKKLPEALYVHKDCLLQSHGSLFNLISVLQNSQSQLENYNVLKFFTSEFKVSFLLYPEFFVEPHPELKRAIHICLASGKIKKFNYEGSDNPPILHRKEEFLKKPHPSIKMFRALTLAEEIEGLYENTSIIGFKRNWQLILDSKGLFYEGHKLLKKGSEVQMETSQCNLSDIKVHRHRTAINRYNFSTPVQKILDYELLKSGETFFDYGCGLGDDLRGLEVLGFHCWGWDPNHCPKGVKKNADVVNLGFVLNVIEDPVERMEALKAAFSYSKNLLIVSTMLHNSNTSESSRIFSDGVLTSRNTFQKYFYQDELRQYIEDVLEVSSAIALAPGIFAVFKNQLQKQEFLLKRSQRNINWKSVSETHFKIKRKKLIQHSLFDSHKGDFEKLWHRIVELGRLPDKDEYTEYQSFQSKICSLKKGLRICLANFDENILKQAEIRKKSDLLIHVALSNFKEKLKLKDIPAPVIKDIKYFFGNYKKVKKDAIDLLYDLSDTYQIDELCAKSEIGFYNDGRFYVRIKDVKHLHPLLRLYIRIGELLYGYLEEVGLIKIHCHTSKLTFHFFDDFEGKVLPQLKVRVKIKIPTNKVWYYDYDSQDYQQLLYHKVRFYNKDEPEYKKLLRHSQKLEELGISRMSHGPSKTVFEEILRENGLTENLYPKRN